MSTHGDGSGGALPPPPGSTDRTRGFTAFPARKGRAVRAQTWWGRSWTAALEESALDLEQLRNGRRSATSGLVGPISVGPGRIAAAVSDGTEDAMYHASVGFDVLSDEAWDRFSEDVAAKAGHVAALLDGDMPRDLVKMASAAGVRLLPGLGDLEPECDCPGWEHPCEHAAALSYQVSWLLDADPFVLVLLRGRTQAEFLDGLHAVHRPADAVSSQVEVRGSEAGDLPVPMRGKAPLPLPPPPPLPGPLATPLAGLPSAPGIPDGALETLAAGAAARARAILAGTASK